MEKNINLIVGEDENNLRLDVFINKRENLISRSRIKNLILKEKLKINDQIINSPSKKVLSGDEINLQIPEPKEASLKPYNFKLQIVYEDDDLLIINKPAGIIMHPGAGNYDETIVNALMHYNKDSLSTIGDELRPGIVHRIDKDTSGLIVIAKNNETHENLSHQFSEHTITRVYQLLIWGKLRPSSGKIDTFITRSSKNRQMMEVSNSKGKRAITNYKTIEIFENDKTPTLSLVECRLETGRTHQIRVHMTHMGNSIMGDGKYKINFIANYLNGTSGRVQGFNSGRVNQIEYKDGKPWVKTAHKSMPLSQVRTIDNASQQLFGSAKPLPIMNQLPPKELITK
mgnify:CR=1 FL=1